MKGRTTPRQSSVGLGEAAVAEFYTRIDEIVDPNDPVLVLFEDSDVRRINAIVQGNVHLVSTRAFLNGLQERGLIASADAIWQAIHSAGRTPSAREIDLPSPDAYGGSRWK